MDAMKLMETCAMKPAICKGVNAGSGRWRESDKSWHITVYIVCSTVAYQPRREGGRNPSFSNSPALLSKLSDLAKYEYTPMTPKRQSLEKQSLENWTTPDPLSMTVADDHGGHVGSHSGGEAHGPRPANRS